MLGAEMPSAQAFGLLNGDLREHRSEVRREVLVIKLAFRGQHTRRAVTESSGRRNAKPPQGLSRDAVAYLQSD